MPGARELIGIIGRIGLVVSPVVMEIKVIIVAVSLMGIVFTVTGSAIMTAFGAVDSTRLSYCLRIIFYQK